MKVFKLGRFSIKWKIIFAVFVSFIVILAIQSVLTITYFRQYSLNSLERNAVILSSSIAFGAADPLSIAYLSKVTDQIKSIKSLDKSIQYINVIDTLGSIQCSTDDSVTGKSIKADLFNKIKNINGYMVRTKGRNLEIITPIVIYVVGDMNVIGYLQLGITQKYIRRVVRNVSLMIIVVGIGFIIIYFYSQYLFLTKTVISPINNVVASLKGISEGAGDLTKTIAVDTDDEIGQLCNFFNDFVKTLNRMVVQIDSTARSTAGKANKIFDSFDGINSAIDDIATSVEDVTQGGHSLNDMTSTTLNEIVKLNKQISEIVEGSTDINNHSTLLINSAQSSKDFTKVAHDKMESIKNGVSSNIKEVNELNSKSQEIHQVLEVISSISKQTNLLALNASIEAARAGIHGKGFNVVSEEIRKLAESTSEATKQIKEIIDEIIIKSNSLVTTMDMEGQNVNEGSFVIKQALDSIDVINNEIVQLEPKIRSIDSRAKKQLEISNMVQQSMLQVQNYTKNSINLNEKVNVGFAQINASAENVASISNDLSIGANNLVELVNSFKTIEDNINE